MVNKYCVIIRTIDNNKHLDNVDQVIDLVKKYIVDKESTKLSAARYEASTKEFVYDIEDVERLYNGITVDVEILEEYNRKRKANIDYYQKERTAECYTSKQNVRYFLEGGICMDKEITFSTAEYYDQRIGVVITNIGLSYYTRDSKLTNSNLKQVLKELEQEQFERFLKCHKEEYIETLE